MNPTNDTYKTLTVAYDFFNKELFSGKLPNCMITMQRKSKARGYFSPERFETRKKETFAVHEIALNPSHFKDRSDEDIISTLVHEMTHLWQEEFGQHNPRRNYHNMEWAEKMAEHGLTPSNTGEEGGRKTGQSMTHFIAKDGKYSELIKKFFQTNSPLNYQDKPLITLGGKAGKSKTKYTCPKCATNAWGKPNLLITCGLDKAEFIANA